MRSPSAGKSVRARVRAHWVRSRAGSTGTGASGLAEDGVFRVARAASVLDALDAPVLDHGVGEQLGGQLPHQPLRRLAIAGGELDLEQLALADVRHGLVPEGGARALDRTSLGVEDVRLQGHAHDGLHAVSPRVRRKMASTLRRAASRSKARSTSSLVSTRPIAGSARMRSRKAPPL